MRAWAGAVRSGTTSAGPDVKRTTVGHAAIVVAMMAAAVGYARCSIYDDSLLGDGGGGGDVASPPDGGDAGSSCAHAAPPARPATDDPADADIEFVSVVDNLDFGLDGGVGGYDLDRTCTCPDPESCTPAANAPQHCDRAGGRDNSGGALLATFAQLSAQFDPSGVNNTIQSGRGSLLMRVSGYNGAANDTSVRLGVFISNGTVPLLDDAGTNPTPLHDGTDTWGVDPASLIGTPPPYVASHEDGSAYVSGGVLVGSVDFPLGIGLAFGQDFLQLHGAYVTATVIQTAHGYALQGGMIAGRWDTRNLLTAMQVAKDPFDKSVYLCGSDPTYQAIKKSICQAADIARVVQNDNTGAPCDAISLAVGFDTEPALFGGVLPPNSIALTPCGASYSDQCGN
jgi:hypothetical protein